MNENVLEHLYTWLVKRSAGSSQHRIRADGIIALAVKALDLDLVQAREAFRALRDEGSIFYTTDLNGLPFSGYLHVKREQAPVPESHARWQAVLESELTDEQLISQLLCCHEMFDDLPDADLVRLVSGLKRIYEKPVSSTAFSYDLSAKFLLGSSKVLDKLPEPIKRALGVAHFPATPRYIVVAGPPDPIAVLLIENTTSFEVAVRSGLASKVTLIAAYGYGLNMMMDSVAGWSLVDTLFSGNYEVLSRLGGPHQPESLFTHPNIYFWGDLDLEGLRIALALRKKIPSLRLSGLYAPMIEAVRDADTSHPYCKAAGKVNQLTWKPIGEMLFDQLAQQCALRALDQEYVAANVIARLGSTGLVD